MSKKLLLLKDTLKEHKISITKLSVVIGVDRRTLHGYLNGEYYPSHLVLKKLVRALAPYNIDFEDLFPRSKREL